MKVSMDEIVRGFARFLSASWGETIRAAGVLEHLDTAGFMNDWVQANWELLVEMPFRDSAGNVYLEPYGEGAECNDPSSRVWNPEALPTHRVVCIATEATVMVDLLTEREIDTDRGLVVFDRFAVHSSTGWYEEAPPFDCVPCYHGNQVVLVRADVVSFVIEAIDAYGP